METAASRETAAGPPLHETVMISETLAKLQKLDRAEPTSRGKAHDDERMMQFMFTNRPLEKVALPAGGRV